MAEPMVALESAFEEAGFDIAESSRNRDRIRIAVADPEASGERLRELTRETLDEDDIFGFNVTTESLDDENVVTAVSFRYRG